MSTSAISLQIMILTIYLVWLRTWLNDRLDKIIELLQEDEEEETCTRCHNPADDPGFVQTDDDCRSWSKCVDEFHNRERQ